jgi:hypothetical protein
VLSAWPTEVTANCLASRRVFDAGSPGALWCYKQATSMASPHAAGVAALIISRYGMAGAPQGKLSANQLMAFLTQTADPQACPESLPTGYSTILGVNSGLP